MKSIKEKADEYGKVNLTDWGVVSTERVEGFEAGANYVLDAVEEATNICFDEELRNVIQQLKK